MLKLRPLDFQPVFYQNEPMWLLRDPLQLSGEQLIVPPALAQLLLLLDGSRDLSQLHNDFSREVGEAVPYQLVADTVARLDDAYLLDNARSAAARQGQLTAYRALPFRPPALADICYPAEPARLQRELAAYGAGQAINGAGPWRGRGIVSPHIDYQRGGPVYARLWARTAGVAAEAELVLVFGTDHNGGPGTITLTRQPYATPYGVLPTDLALIDALATAIGPEEAFAEELHHRQEHSVELSAVWLHHVYQQLGLAPRPMVPILVGSFHRFVQNGRHPAQDERLNRFLAALRESTAGRRVLAVASVDLAHVGPQFGDNFRMDAARRERLRAADQRLIQAILRGDATGFYSQVAAVGDRNRICGLSSIYLMLRYLQNEAGVSVAYEQCPADPEDDSLVSICGLLLE